MQSGHKILTETNTSRGGATSFTLAIRLACVLVVIASCCARAGGAETSELIIVSGGNSIEYWKEDSYVEAAGKGGYFGVGTIYILPRAAQTTPLDVKIWCRGIKDTVFFELTRQGTRPGSPRHVKKPPSRAFREGFTQGYEQGYRQYAGSNNGGYRRNTGGGIELHTERIRPPHA
jgi:hypothetical protein